MTKREFQVHVEFEADGAEEVYNFDDLSAAQHAFRQHCDTIANNKEPDDVHVELIEVLEQECIEPEFEEGD